MQKSNLKKKIEQQQQKVFTILFKKSKMLFIAYKIV